MASVAAPASPATPPPSEARRRRLHAASTRERLWKKTRWSTLDEEEKEEEGLPTAPLPPSCPALGPSAAEIRQIVNDKFEELAVNLAAGLAKVIDDTKTSLDLDIAKVLDAKIERKNLLAKADLAFDMAAVLETVVERTNLVAKSDLDNFRKEIKQMANVKKEGLRKKVDTLYQQVADINGRLQDIEQDIEKDEDDVFVAAQPRLGESVRIFGLLTRPELNGSCGVLRGFDADRGRWQVQVGGQMLSLKRSNLQLESRAAGTR